MARLALQTILALMDKPTTKAVKLEVLAHYKGRTKAFHWVWANEFGRTLISLNKTLSSPELPMIPALLTIPAPQPLQIRTLSIGFEERSISVYVQSYSCWPPPGESVFNFLLYQLFKMENDHNYRLCHSEQYENGDISRIKCCIVRGYEKILFCADHVSKTVKYVRGYIAVVTTIIVVLGIPLLLKYIRSFREVRKDYQLSDSPMALSFILRSLLIEEKGSVVSAQRRLIFSLMVTVILYVCESRSTWAVIALVWIIPFTALDLFGTRPGAIDEDIVSCFPSQTYTYNIYVKLLTLPFNVKYWRKIYNSCFKMDYQLIANHELPSWMKLFLFFQDLFFIFLYLAFFVCICLFDLSFLILLWFLYLSFPPISLCNGSLSCFPILCVILSLAFIIRSLIAFLSMAFFFLAGLYLNGEYYSHIVAPAMLFAFYAWKCWRSCVEAKYAKLKTNIYEFCEELANENSNNVVGENASIASIVDGHDSPLTLDVKTGTMAKALYDSIRGTYLPYDDILFSFFVRLFIVANFCLFLSAMILFSQSSGISGELQVISAMTVGILPFIFDIIWADDALVGLADKKMKLMLGQTVDFERRSGNVIYVRVTSEERNVLLF
jgi:hypothetical protein